MIERRVLKNLLLLGALFIVLGTFSCATGPASGVLFSSVKFAGAVNASNEVSADVSAEGCQHQILMLFAAGDAGAGQIAKENNIRRIATVDHSALNVLSFLYRNYCTVVTVER